MQTEKVIKRVFLTVTALIACVLILCLGFWLIDGRSPQAYLVAHALPQTTMEAYEKGKGDMQGLPPTDLYAGTWETLYTDVVKTHDKMKAAGVDVRLHVKEKMGHVYPLWPCPEGKAARKEIAEIITAI